MYMLSKCKKISIFVLLKTFHTIKFYKQFTIHRLVSYYLHPIKVRMRTDTNR